MVSLDYCVNDSLKIPLTSSLTNGIPLTVPLTQDKKKSATETGSTHVSIKLFRVGYLAKCSLRCIVFETLITDVFKARHIPEIQRKFAAVLGVVFHILM